jgi:adenylate cyclase
MTQSLQPVRSVLRELRRRRVFRVGAVYAAVAWALIEGASTVLPRLGVPDWSITLVIVLALFGLPLALVLAWAYDVTPDGIRRAEDAPAGETRSMRLLPSAALIGVIVLSVAAGLTVRGMRVSPADSRSHDGIRSIAVLPFENAGTGGNDEYLSEGIAEELLHRLSRVPELRVAARTSSFAFRQGVDVREIGSKLNVDVVLEGSVLSIGDRLRVRARLVSTRDGYQLWSESYEPELTDIFRVQDEISAAIIARMLPAAEATTAASGDRAGIAASATSNPAAEPASYEAFELYMRGRYEWNRRTEAGLRSAVRYFEQAIARSPGYARAHLGLADASAVLAFYDYVPPREGSRTRERRHAARSTWIRRWRRHTRHSRTSRCITITISTRPSAGSAVPSTSNRATRSPISGMRTC